LLFFNEKQRSGLLAGLISHKSGLHFDRKVQARHHQSFCGDDQPDCVDERLGKSIQNKEGGLVMY